VKDEAGVVFAALDGVGASRASPLATKSPELARGLSDRDLQTLLSRSQQAATSPELGC
jgi:hypothetical protein